MAKNKALISSLYGKYEGKPILVIGGGPSALTDLATIPLDYPACVITANEHGYKQDRFKVDYSVSVDFTYNTGHILMERHLAKFNAVTISRWTWADYRLPDWIIRRRLWPHSDTCGGHARRLAGPCYRI